VISLEVKYRSIDPVKIIETIVDIINETLLILFMMLIIKSLRAVVKNIDSISSGW
jgi:hypothetical protein